MSNFLSRVAWRVLVEFGLPLAFACLWICFGPKGSSGALTFSFLFFSASWFWGQFLRIWYQQSQIDRFAGLGTDLNAIKSTMAIMKQSIADLTATHDGDITQEVERLRGLANTANNQIDSANTRYQAARSYVLHADAGYYGITGSAADRPRDHQS